MMTATDTVARVSPYLERLVHNSYAQDQLAEAVQNLRGAYERASKRRVEATRDNKVRQQLRQATASISEAASALKNGRERPKRRPGRWLLVALGVGALLAAAVLASNEHLRSRILGLGAKPSAEEEPDLGPRNNEPGA
jgi:hypothetical protein